MRRLPHLLLSLATVAAALGLVAPSTEAIDVAGSPAYNVSYSYDTSYSVPQAMKDRISNAAWQWNSASPGTLSYSSSSSNEIGFRSQTAIGKVNAVGCDGSGCWLWLDLTRHLCDQFYYGTGSSAGTSYTGQYWCPDGSTRSDAYGVLVHELGHWRGLTHHLFGACQDPNQGDEGTLYSPEPTREAASMCYSTSWPRYEDGTGSAGIVPRRTISQDEVQGVLVQQSNHFAANNGFSECPGCSWDDAPRYWMFSPGSNHWRGTGLVSLNNNSSVPYPEIKQRVRGDDADMDDDGRFSITARVKGVSDSDNGQAHRAVLFVRHVHGSITNHEQTCPSTANSYLTLGQWTVFTCTVDLTNQATEFEYGVRVTNKVDIDYIRVSDR